MVRSDNTGDAVHVTWDQVHAFRMERHHLDRPVPRPRLAQAVGDACGIQAQVMAAAQLAIRVRVRGVTLRDVEQALWKDRSVARVWCMRGTVHLVPSAELAVFVRGSSTRQLGRVAAWMARSGAPPGSDLRLVEAAVAAMDRPRSRIEIAERIRDALGVSIEKRGSRGWGSPADAAGFRVGRLVFTVPDLAFMASYRALACFGPDNGQGSTFVRPDAWLPTFRDMSVEDAEDAFLRRYLKSFGPATVHDFAMWSILTLGRARQIWSRLEAEMVSVAVDGRAGWILRRDLPALTRAELDRPTVRLLPYFDSYLMGHRGRDHLIDTAHHKRIYQPAGWVYPAVLVDGRIAGEWSYERRGKRLRLKILPYAPMDEAIKERVRTESEDVARFLEAPEVRVSFAKAR